MLRHYAECNYAQCHFLFTIMLNVVMLSLNMLSIVMLSVVGPSIACGIVTVNYLDPSLIFYPFKDRVKWSHRRACFRPAPLA